jgi:predicted ferric reductase
MAYAATAVLPLAVVLAGSPPPGRNLVLELGSALGIVGLSLLSLHLALPARMKLVAAPLGADAALRLHRHLTDVIVAVIAAHVALVVLGDPSNVALLDPLGAPWRARAAVGACTALAALIASSLLRTRVRLAYARWRGLHVALAVSALALSALHAVGVGHYLRSPGGLVVAVLGAFALLAVVELRVLGPWRLARRPYVVDRVRPERGGAVTLALRAEGHRGRPFRPGQFAWLKLADAPHGLAEHPFSYASSAARPERPCFTIKAYCGFTRRVAELPPGTRLLLDGPHGSFKPRPHAERFVLLAGGIGITPVVSLLRSAADASDPRPFLLLYGSANWEHITFREELETLRQRVNLRVVHVLTDPPPGWQGETGFIDAPLLGRHLPSDLRRTELFLCGPPPMLTAAIAGLERFGVAPADVHAEQFVNI